MDGPIQWMLKVCEILSTGAALALETADGWSPMKDLYGFLIFSCNVFRGSDGAHTHYDHYDMVSGSHV